VESVLSSVKRLVVGTPASGGEGLLAGGLLLAGVPAGGKRLTVRALFEGGTVRRQAVVGTPSPAIHVERTRASREASQKNSGVGGLRVGGRT
jgi:hypothetical protein